jgi:hypothetical protein
MAHFVRIGQRIMNVGAVALAEREGDRLKVTLMIANEKNVIIFEGVEADRVEAEILRYQQLNDEFLRRNRVVSAQNFS